MKQIKIESKNGVTLRVRKYVDGMIGLQRTYKDAKSFTDNVFVQSDQVETLTDFLNDNLDAEDAIGEMEKKQ